MFRVPRLLQGCGIIHSVIRQSSRVHEQIARQHSTAVFQLKRNFASGNDTVKLTFEFPDGKRHEVSAKEGESLLDVVINNDVDIDGFGACEGTLACSTCHLILPPDLYEAISSDVSDEEVDMLDLAFGLEETSRLGCQCVVNRDFEDVVVKVPEGVNDQR